MGNTCRKINRKAQSTLEAAIIFAIAVLFLGSITRIWLWSNSQIVERQIRYNATRVAAGTSSLDYNLRDHWPVYTPESVSRGEGE